MRDPTGGTVFDLAHLRGCVDGDVINLDAPGGDGWVSVAVDRAHRRTDIHTLLSAGTRTQSNLDDLGFIDDYVAPDDVPDDPDDDEPDSVEGPPPLRLLQLAGPHDDTVDQWAAVLSAAVRRQFGCELTDLTHKPPDRPDPDEWLHVLEEHFDQIIDRAAGRRVFQRWSRCDFQDLTERRQQPWSPATAEVGQPTVIGHVADTLLGDWLDMLPAPAVRWLLTDGTPLRRDETHRPNAPWGLDQTDAELRHRVAVAAAAETADQAKRIALAADLVEHLVTARPDPTTGLPDGFLDTAVILTAWRSGPDPAAALLWRHRALPDEVRCGRYLDPDDPLGQAVHDVLTAHERRLFDDHGARGLAYRAELARHAKSDRVDEGTLDLLRDAAHHVNTNLCVRECRPVATSAGTLAEQLLTGHRPPPQLGPCHPVAPRLGALADAPPPTASTWRRDLPAGRALLADRVALAPLRALPRSRWVPVVPEPDPQLWWTTERAAEVLGSTVDEVHRAVNRGRLPGYRIDGRVLLRPGDVTNWAGR